MVFSDYSRALAVEIVARNGGVLDTATLADIRVALGVPDLKQQTVRYWLKTAQNDQKPKVLSAEKSEPTKPQQDLVEVAQKVSRALDEKLELAAHRFVNHATKKDTIEKMSGQAAMTSAAIAIDKMRLLRDLPTEIIGAAPVLIELAEFLRNEGKDFSEVQRQFLGILRAKAEANRA